MQPREPKSGTPEGGREKACVCMCGSGFFLLVPTTPETPVDVLQMRWARCDDACRAIGSMPAHPMLSNGFLIVHALAFPKRHEHHHVDSSVYELG